MITPKLVNGQSLHTCTICPYQTGSADKMLKHLNEHRLDQVKAKELRE